MTARTPTAPAARHGLLARFTSFITEKHPFALRPAVMALDMAIGSEAFDERDPAAVDRLREPLRRMLLQTLGDFVSLDAASAQKLAAGVPETTPGVSVNDRLHHAGIEILQSCDGFLRREAIAASLTPEERREILRGMILTRAVDNRLKAFFTGSEVQYKGVGFQGKGFRSLGQEAIYAAPLRLRRGFAHRTPDGSWRGDGIAPLIRDLGAPPAMRPEAETVRMVLSAQMGKAGPPMDGPDLHIGD